MVFSYHKLLPWHTPHQWVSHWLSRLGFSLLLAESKGPLSTYIPMHSPQPMPQHISAWHTQHPAGLASQTQPRVCIWNSAFTQEAYQQLASVVRPQNQACMHELPHLTQCLAETYSRVTTHSIQGQFWLWEKLQRVQGNLKFGAIGWAIA